MIAFDIALLTVCGIAIFAFIIYVAANKRTKKEFIKSIIILIISLVIIILLFLFTAWHFKVESNIFRFDIYEMNLKEAVKKARLSAEKSYSLKEKNAENINKYELKNYGNEEYIGEWKHGLRNGYGVYTFESGNKYEGEWEYGLRYGYGIFTYADGNRYEGEFKNEMCHGYGIYTWANGNRYEGEFRNGYAHGYGILYDKDGSEIQKGYWANNKFIE